MSTGTELRVGERGNRLLPKEAPHALRTSAGAAKISGGTPCTFSYIYLLSIHFMLYLDYYDVSEQLLFPFY